MKVRYTFPPARMDVDDPSESHVMPPLAAAEDDDSKKPARPYARKHEPETLAELAGIVERKHSAKQAKSETPKRLKLPPLVTHLKRSPSTIWGLVLVILLLVVAVLPHIPLPDVQLDIPVLQGAVAAQATGCTWHTVAAGETLSQLSEEYDVSIDAIARANHIHDTSAIRVNQRLCIPFIDNGTQGLEGSKADPAKYGSAHGVADFTKYVLPYARRAHDDTGWPLSMILAQWGLEQGWETPRFTGYNWGNCGAVPDEPMVPGTSAPGSPDNFAYAPTPEDGLRIYLHVAHLHYYTEIAPAAKQGADAAARALGRSPWDAGHYTDHGDPGSSLITIMQDFNLYQYDK
ncbi:MAG TPA: LysM peptidoglycan-binding domain-containing protein [Ktedonobacterales bacterium]|nr:LysM peptidoglycan-binding domain-containing protein [Ktedonobacterales bacterium]